MRALRLAAVALLLVAMPACTPGVGLGGGPATMTVTAYFDDAAGLFEGNDVGILGVTVGRVVDIEPEGDRVKVTVEVDDDHPIPVDVGAAIVSRSVATDRYIELTPVYSGGEKLADGADIGLERTASPVDFDEVLAAINELSTGIVGSKDTTDAVRRFIDEGSAALDGRGELFNSTVGSLSEAVNGVSGQRDEIVATVVSLDALVTSVARNERTVRTFIRQVSAASGQLADEREEFRATLRSLDRAVTTVAEFAVTNRDEVVAAFGGSTRLMRTVLAKQDQLEEFLETFPLALQNLQLLQNGDRIPVRIDPIALLPLGSVLREACEALPFGLCEVIAGTDPGTSAVPRRRR